jgi:signal transduction histidine kinase
LSDLGGRCCDIAHHLDGLIPFDGAALTVLNEAGRVAQTWRLDPHDDSFLPSPEAMAIPKSAELTTVAQHPIGTLLTHDVANAMLLVPLRAAGRPVGLLTLVRSGPGFSDRDGEVGTTVAALMASVHSRMMVEGQVRSSEQLAAFDGFSRMLAHEIRNPLNSLSLHAQLLGRKLAKEGLIPTQQAALDEHLDVLRGEIRRLDNLVSDFLALTREDLSASTEIVDLRELCAGVIDVHRPTVAEHHIELKLVLGETPAYAQIKASRIQQVLHNLVKNAVDALLLAKSRTLTVEIRRRDATVEVRIRDTGPGVPDTNNVFSPTFSTKPGGGGMGLPVSRQIARLHGGHLVALHPDEGGAEFVLSLPTSPGSETTGDLDHKERSAS